MALVPGQNLGSYQIVEQIGRGGMATVYRAFQPALSRHVAIKVLPAFYAEDPTFLERFRREAVVVANLRHPNILAVFDTGEEGGVTYMVSELIDGGTLADSLGRPCTIEYCLSVLRPIAAALDYAHSRGVVHRDVKPSNILLTSEGTPVLSDFGIARIVHGNATALTTVGSSVGTPAYMAPEQATASTVGSTADVYALAVILYEMLTGSVPYQAETPLAVILAHVHDPLPLPWLRNPAITEAVEGVLLKGLAKQPDDRFPTAGALIGALEAAAGVAEPRGQGTTSVHVVRNTPSAASRSSPNRSKVTRNLAGVALIGLILIAATLVVRNGIGAGRDESLPPPASPVRSGAVASPMDPSECLTARQRVAAADNAIRTGALLEAGELLHSVQSCSEVSVASTLTGITELLRAKEAEQQGNWDEALGSLQVISTTDPGFPGLVDTRYSMLVGAGRGALTSGDLQRALELCGEAQSARPNGPEAALCLSDAQPATATPIPPPAATLAPAPATPPLAQAVPPIAVAPPPPAAPAAATQPPAVGSPSGTIVAADAFNDPAQGLLPSAFPGAGFRAEYLQGEYLLEKLDDSLRVIGTTFIQGEYADAVLTVDARIVGEAPSRFANLGCRMPVSTVGYRLQVEPEARRWRLFRPDGDPNAVVTLMDWRISPAIRRGNETNRFELSCVGDTIAVSINGTPVGSVQDATYASGRFTLGVSANELGEVRFDNLTIRQP